MAPMIVSDVGRTMRGSSSGSVGVSLPSVLVWRRVWVTTAHSLAKPSMCSASFSIKLLGMKRGKYAF